jgi:hypothetical protein
LYEKWPKWEYLFIITFTSLIMILLAGLILKKLDRIYPKEVL